MGILDLFKSKPIKSDRLPASEVGSIQCSPFLYNAKTYKMVNIEYIPLIDENIEIVHKVVDEINKIIAPYNRYFAKKLLGHKFNTSYSQMLQSHFIQIRCGIKTPTGKEAKYPTVLFLNYWDNNYGSNGVQIISFDKDGNIGKAKLSFVLAKEQISYQIDLKRDKDTLFVRKITKTIYFEPYGTTTVYLKE